MENKGDTKITTRLTPEMNMKNTILFIVCCALIGLSCSKQPEKETQSRDSLSDRLDIISRAKEVQQLLIL